MADILKKYIKKVNIVTVVSAFVLIVVLVISSKYNVAVVNNTTDEDDINVIRIEEADLYNSTGEVLSTTVPVRLPRDIYYMYISQRKEDMYTPVNFEITSINTLFTVSCCNGVIYKNSLEPKLKNLCFPSVNLIEIPEKYDGKDIKVTFESAISNSSTVNIPKVRIGSKRALINNTLNNELVELVLSAIVFLLAYILVFASIILFKAKAGYHQVYYVAIFSILISVLSILNTGYVKILFPNSIVLYYVYYLFFSTLPISLLILHYHQLSMNDLGKWGTNFTKYILYAESLVVISQIVYIFLNYEEPVYLYVFVIINIVMSAIGVPISMAYFNGKKYNDIYKLLIAIIPIFLIYFESITYYFNLRIASWDMHFTSIYAIWFLGVYLHIALTTYYKSYKQLAISNYYENIAFVDSLTGVGSRHALENDIQSIKDKNIDKFIIMFIDVNSLKLINDKMGHKAGDMLLQSLGKIIIDAESVFSNINGYRFGGDEFIIIIKKSRLKVAEKIKVFLNDNAEKLRKSDKNIPLSLAIAYDEVIIDDNMYIEDIIKNADKKMYEEKSKKEKIFE